MTRAEFLNELKDRLKVFEKPEIDNWLNYYSEIIDDRMEDGQSEEEAVKSLGSIDAIFDEILQQTPITKLAKTRLNRKTLRSWETVLLILGFPIWLPLLIAAVAVILAVYVSLWAVIISLWSVFAALIGAGVGVVIGGVVFVCVGNTLSGVALLGAGLVSIGLSVFCFFGCKAATSGTIWLAKKLVLMLKNSFIKKEAAK